MRAWLYLLVGAAIVAGATYGLRQSGLDVTALLGLQQPVAAKTNGETPTTGQKPQARGAVPVETARAKLMDISDDIAAIGTLLADESVAIAPETSGRVAAILFADGGTAEKGAELFKLDADLANAALAEAEARLALAEANLTRNQSLRKSGNVAQSTLDAVQTERDMALSAVESARVLLRKLTITAPFSGSLAFRAVSEGAYVTAGTPLVQLDKIDRLKVGFSVPELQQSRIAAGQRIVVTADALPGENFTAVVSALNPSIDVNGRALQVRADLDNRELKLRPGLLVRILVQGTPRQAVMVPEAAIVQRGESVLVFVISEGKAKEVPVKPGRRIAAEIEIAVGIATGDEVVTAGNTRLSDGVSVEVVSTAAAAE